MRERAPCGHPPSHLSTAPALQSRGSLPRRGLPPRDGGQEPTTPSRWGPRLRPRTLSLRLSSAALAYGPTAGIPTKMLLTWGARH
jgi:hypothetical protein